mmetsp:Transcript_110673/g.308368  ORF Transcript_110673/g.308368 Transcript_110673/m.308368 type:complete len:279 (+) Transcript_110673:1065-1901(+)
MHCPPLRRTLPSRRMRLWSHEDRLAVGVALRFLHGRRKASLRRHHLRSRQLMREQAPAAAEAPRRVRLHPASWILCSRSATLQSLTRSRVPAGNAAAQGGERVKARGRARATTRRAAAGSGRPPVGTARRPPAGRLHVGSPPTGRPLASRPTGAKPVTLRALRNPRRPTGLTTPTAGAEAAAGAATAGAEVIVGRRKTRGASMIGVRPGVSRSGTLSSSGIMRQSRVGRHTNQRTRVRSRAVRCLQGVTQGGRRGKRNKRQERSKARSMESRWHRMNQ